MVSQKLLVQLSSRNLKEIFNRLKISFRFLLLNCTRSFWLTIRTSLSNRAFATTTPHGNTVDDESLLGFVSQATCLVRPSGTRSPMNLSYLAILPATDSEQVSHHIALLFAVQLGYVLVGTHPDLPFLLL